MSKEPTITFETFKLILEGQRIEKCEETDSRTGAFMLLLENGVRVGIDQQGDDMSYVDVSVKGPSGQSRVF